MAINHWDWLRHENVKSFTLCLLTSILLDENICPGGQQTFIVQRPEHVFEGHGALNAPLWLEQLLDVVVEEVLPDVLIARHPLHVIHIHSMEHQAVSLRPLRSRLRSWGWQKMFWNVTFFPMDNIELMKHLLLGRCFCSSRGNCWSLHSWTQTHPQVLILHSLYPEMFHWPPWTIIQHFYLDLLFKAVNFSDQLNIILFKWNWIIEVTTWKRTFHTWPKAPVISYSLNFVSRI